MKRLANLALGALLMGSGILYSFPPEQYHFYPLCPIYATTHLLCPGCGGTRALYQLLHLNFSAAWHFNAMVTLAAPLALLWFGFWYFSVRNNRAPEFCLPLPATVALLVLTVFFDVARNAGLALVS